MEGSAITAGIIKNIYIFRKHFDTSIEKTSRRIEVILFSACLQARLRTAN